MRQHFNTLFREADCCEDEEIKRSKPLAVIPKVVRETNKLHLSALTDALFFIIGPEEKHEYDIFYIVNKAGYVIAFGKKCPLCRHSKAYTVHYLII
ncbi:Hypothetical predicted protein [Scomber scombrus]|uniref:Uncharacterized protein n=1 Tax=Scomber scombrus TaxID=13677 RepID=A0AAV1P7Z7_SCOSC